MNKEDVQLWAVTVISLAATVIIVFSVYTYRVVTINKAAIEAGLVEQVIPGTYNTMWVKAEEQ